MAGRLAHAWINSKLTPLVIVASLMLGAFAVVTLPREEEPQIIVPMIDIFVGMPGASAREVEERVTKPMEKLLWEIPGVEYIYSTSQPRQAMAIVRFKVGEDEEKSIVRLNQKMFANFDLIPPGATPPLIKPRSIDDVPILALTFWSKRYGDYRTAPRGRAGARRRQAGGRCLRRHAHRRAAARGSRHARRQRAWPLTLFRPCRFTARWALPTAACPPDNSPAGTASSYSKPVSSCARPTMSQAWWWASPNGKPIFVRDVADRHRRRRRAVTVRAVSPPAATFYPAVTLAVSKRKGTNAISVAEHVLTRVEGLKGNLIPARRATSPSRATTAKRRPRNRTNCCSTWASPSFR